MTPSQTKVAEKIKEIGINCRDFRTVASFKGYIDFIFTIDFRGPECELVERQHRIGVGPRGKVIGSICGVACNDLHDVIQALIRTLAPVRLQGVQ